MGAFFDGIDERQGTHAAIHCNKTVCYRLAQATRGGFQAIEEMGAGRLQMFAAAWDASSAYHERFTAIDSLMDDCFYFKQLAHGEAADPHDAAMHEEMRAVSDGLGGVSSVSIARRLFFMAKERPSWRLFRREIWRDGDRAVAELESGRVSTMVEAVASVRHRVASAGRNMPNRTVSTPLLLKGLEFDHVLVPNAPHFLGERYANAKLFYVAISRATQTLTISSPQPILIFPPAQI
jgi:superfamily I DNA/RNA helicase